MRYLGLLALLAGVGCGGDADGGNDAGPVDLGVSPSDAGVDSGPVDAGAPDAGPAEIDCTDATEPVVGTGGFTGIRVHADDPLLEAVGSLVGDGAGMLWAHDAVGNGAFGDRVVSIDPDGTVTSLAAPVGWAFCTVSQLARASSGDLFIYEIASNQLQRVTAAGAVTPFSTVGDIGGGGGCANSGVIGLLVRDDGSFVVGSPANGTIETLTADGTTRGPFAVAETVYRLESDGGDGLYAVSGGRLLHVSAAGDTDEILGDTFNVLDVTRDPDDGALYVVSPTRVLRTDDDGAGPFDIASCFTGSISSIELDAPTGGGETSLYVSTLGASIEANDGDAIFELTR